MKAFVTALIKANEQKALAIVFDKNPEYFWMEVESSNTKRIRHNHFDPRQTSQELKNKGGLFDVEFKSGQVYRYTGVPLNLYQEMLKAESAGKYFIEHIKPNYSFVLLTPKK